MSHFAIVFFLKQMYFSWSSPSARGPGTLGDLPEASLIKWFYWVLFDTFLMLNGEIWTCSGEGFKGTRDRTAHTKDVLNHCRNHFLSTLITRNVILGNRMYWCEQDRLVDFIINYLPFLNLLMNLTDFLIEWNFQGVPLHRRTDEIKFVYESLVSPQRDNLLLVFVGFFFQIHISVSMVKLFCLKFVSTSKIIFQPFFLMQWFNLL